MKHKVLCWNCKIETEALWNELIFLKFSEKVKVDKNELLKRIKENPNNISKSYLMSEILFEIKENEDIQKKYQQISDFILNNGFENAALKFSISETAKSGGLSIQMQHERAVSACTPMEVGAPPDTSQAHVFWGCDFSMCFTT